VILVFMSSILSKAPNFFLAHYRSTHVAVSGKDEVAVVDLKSLDINGNVSPGKQPDGLAWVQRN
jgi:hypothetical protein